MERLGQWLTVLTNISVLIGLVFLIYEVDQNSQALRNETDVAIYSIATDLLLLQAESRALAELVSRAATTKWHDFTPTEQIRLDGYWQSMAGTAELQFRLFTRRGESPDNIVFPEQMFGWESFRSHWETIRFLYEDDFVEYFEKKMSERLDAT